MGDIELTEARADVLARYAPDATARRCEWSRGETEVLEVGSGPPLLLVHGALSDACVWLPIMWRLARDHHVFAVDLPGHGLADPFDYTGVDMPVFGSTFLRDILDALHLPSTSIAANSMGGLWSVALALREPERVTGLVLAGAPLGVNLSLPFPLRAAITVCRVPMMGQRLARRMMTIPNREADRKFWGQVLVVRPERLDETLLDEDMASARRNIESHLGLLAHFGDGGMADARRRLNLGEGWQSLRTPTLFLWGERDRFFRGPGEGEALAARNPSLRVTAIPDAGHIPWVDDPDAVVGGIEQHLASAPM